MRETVKVLFASGAEDLIPKAIAQMRQIFPELPLVVVAEFPPEHQRWIPFPVSRSFQDNLALCRWHFRDKDVRLSAVILQPRVPYWQMRLIGFLISPRNFLAFNENLGHFMLRPRSAGTMLRHFLWRARNFVKWHSSPGGGVYTFLWRLAHPHALRRPLYTCLARLAGWMAAMDKALSSAPDAASKPVKARPHGVSVVIPSRNGKELLARVLPEVARQVRELGGEIIVVDNGSDDGSAAFLRREYPDVAVVESPGALSFARAVNAGIRTARFAHIGLLNNDMVIEPGFFAALLDAFEKVPDLFCATAQILFPPGVRREETGKAVMPAARDRQPSDFPVRCDLPIRGENLSYVLYGSGGCSLYDAAKLLTLGGMDESYQPAYVEDLDLGFRGWRRGWPSVFVAPARVEHRHRATTSRYFSSAFLERTLELNYLRFLARAITEPQLFGRLWREAVERLSLLAASGGGDCAAASALSAAWRAPAWSVRREKPVIPESEILALGCGASMVAPGRAPKNRPVVLIVSPYVPFPLAHGGAVRMYNLMRRAAAEFDQVLVAFGDEALEAPAELLEICSEVVLVKRSGTHLLPSSQRPDVVEEFDSPAFHAALRQTVRKWKPAIAQLEFTQMAQYAGDCAPAKTILVEHDVTLDLYQQLLAQADDWELRYQLERWIPFEKAAWREVDRVVTMSESDRALVGDRAVALANGVDLDRFRPSTEPPEPRRLLFIGSFAHLPNLLAVDFFLREVWPRLQALQPVLHIIAGARRQYFQDRYQNRVQPDLSQPGIEVEDFVADVRPAYRRAAVVVAPLVASAGTNIKIMEAMAMGKAIVSTPAGINGLDLHPGDDVLVTGTACEMAQSIVELFENPARRESLERAARQTVERDFDWDAIARRQAELYLELLKRA